LTRSTFAHYCPRAAPETRGRGANPTESSITTLALGTGLVYGIGAYDAISAVIVKESRADFLWLGSFAVSAALGRPDAGQLTAAEMATVTRIARRSPGLPKPLVVDIDTGYGDASTIAEAARLISEAGADMLCIEDNSRDKESSLYNVGGRSLARRDEHAERIAVARDAVGRDCGVIARTEALVADLGTDEAIDRARAYLEAGADAIFIQATKPDGGRELLEVCTRWNRRSPLFVAPTCYPHLQRPRLETAGVTHVIYANHLLRGAIRGGMWRTSALLDQDALIEAEKMIASINDVASVFGREAVSLSGFRPEPHS
jgi:phosphoenolpyruvate phosphomutase